VKFLLARGAHIDKLTLQAAKASPEVAGILEAAQQKKPLNQ